MFAFYKWIDDNGWSTHDDENGLWTQEFSDEEPLVDLELLLRFLESSEEA